LQLLETVDDEIEQYRSKEVKLNEEIKYYENLCFEC